MICCGPAERCGAALRQRFTVSVQNRDAWVERHAKMIPAGSRVLDVGAGTCKYRPLFSHCVYVAHDFGGLPLHSKEWEGYGRLDMLSDIGALPIATSGFDAVLCTEVLEHVPEPIIAVREMARVLRPGGILLLTAPQRSGGHLAPYHYYGGFTPQWYRHFLGLAGFRKIDVEANGGFFQAYSEESHRYCTIALPRSRIRRHPWLLPVYGLYKLHAAAQSLACRRLDRLDEDRDFAVGYHVSAIRAE